MKRRDEGGRQVGNEGLPLLEVLARRSDPETSHQAATAILDHVTEQERAIVEYLEAHQEGAIGDEIDQALTWRPTTAGRRLARLVRDGGVSGLIIRLDGRAVVRDAHYCQLPAVTRPTRSNRQAQVHIHRKHLDHWLEAL